MTGGLARRSGWTPRLTADERRTLDSLVERLRAAGREPPSVDELAPAVGQDPTPLLRVAEADGSVAQVDVGRYYATENLNEIIAALAAHYSAGDEVTPAAVRDLLGVSRKYVIPLLEYFDKSAITARRGDARSWKGRALRP